MLLLALASVVAFGDAGVADCEMHGAMRGGRAATVAPAAHEPGHDAAPADHAGGHHAGAPAAPDPQGHQDAESPCNCSCIGDCSVTSAAARLPAVPTVRIAVVTAEPHRVFDESSALAAPPEPERLLPFANGPPLG